MVMHTQQFSFLSFAAIQTLPCAAMLEYAFASERRIILVDTMVALKIEKGKNYAPEAH